MSAERGFSRADYEARTEAAQRLMRAQGLDALLFCTEPEIRYFSGFYTQFWQSPARPWFLIIPASGAPIAIIPRIGEALMRRHWLEDVRVWDAPAPQDEGVSLLLDALGGKNDIGLPMGPETALRMPLLDFQKLAARLNFRDCTDLLASMRMVKSEAEIAKIAQSCAAASDAFDRAGALFHKGQPARAAFKAFKKALLDAGADDVPYLVGGAGPGGYDDVISPPPATPLQAGDVLMLDTGATWDGYFCDFDRNFAIAQADDAAKRAHEALWRATEAGLQAARPGARACDLYAAMAAVLGADDGAVGRMGHGLGMQLTEWPSLMPDDETILKENMVITLEPSLQISANRMMVHEENIVICDGPPRLLTRRAPPDLPVIS